MVYPQTSNLFVTGLSVTHTETSQSDYGISFVIPLSDSSKLLCLTSSSTLLHLLCEVYQINKSSHYKQILVTSCQAYVMHIHIHGARALSKTGIEPSVQVLLHHQPEFC